MTFAWDEVFQEEFTTAVANDTARHGFEPSQWFKAGRGSGQGEPWWRENGPGLARAFGEWFESEPDASVWVAPDGRPGIELELRVTFGEIPVVMYVDLILKLGSALVITDYKSGTRPPDTMSQLGLYACGVEMTYGIRPAFGSYFMCKGIGKEGEPKKFFQTPEPLDGYQYSVPYYTEQFKMLDTALEAGIFIPNPGDNCQRCGVNYACAAVGGSEADRYRRESH